MEAQPSFAISSVLDQCLLDLEASEADANVTDEHLLRLSVLLGRTLGKALEVLDQNGVQCFEGDTSKRRLFQVTGRQKQYITLPRRYCSCEAFYHEVVCRGDAPYCKHQVAALLAVALKRCPIIMVPDDALACALLQA